MMRTLRTMSLDVISVICRETTNFIPSWRPVNATPFRPLTRTLQGAFMAVAATTKERLFDEVVTCALLTSSCSALKDSDVLTK